MSTIDSQEPFVYGFFTNIVPLFLRKTQGVSIHDMKLLEKYPAN